MAVLIKILNASSLSLSDSPIHGLIMGWDRKQSQRGRYPGLHQERRHGVPSLKKPAGSSHLCIHERSFHGDGAEPLLGSFSRRLVPGRRSRAGHGLESERFNPVHGFHLRSEARGRCPRRLRACLPLRPIYPG